MERLLGYAVTLQFKVAQKSCRLLRHSEEVGQGIDVLYQDGTQITYQRSRKVVVGRVTATEDETLAVEEAALGMIAKIESHYIESSLIMNTMKTIAAHGNELRLVVGGTRTLGVPFHCSGPEHIGFSMTHTVDVTLQLFIGVDGHIPGEIVVTMGICKEMDTSILGC